MRMKIIAMANDYYDGYVIIGKTIFGKFYKAKFKDYNVIDYGSAPTRTIDVNDYVDTNNFDFVLPMTKSQVNDFLNNFKITGYR